MIPSIHQYQSKTGWNIYHCQQKELPIFGLRLFFSGGNITDDKPGTTRLADHLFLRYLHKSSETKIISGDLSIGTNAQHSIISIEGLEEELPDVLQWIHQSIEGFQFTEKDLDYLRFLAQQDLHYGHDYPEILTSWAMQELYWGEEHPLRFGSIGSLRSLTQITKEDIQISFDSRWRNPRASMIIVSPHKASDIIHYTQSHLPASQSNKPEDLPQAQPHFGSFHIAKEDMTQIELRILRPLFGRSHPLYWGMELGAIAMGGIFYSRINRVLRKEEGLTYGASSSYQYQTQSGFFQLSLSADAKKAEIAIEKSLSLLDECYKNWQPEEVETARKNLKQQMVDSLGTNASIADLMESSYLEGGNPCQLEEYLDRALSTSQHEIEEAMKYLAGAPQILLFTGQHLYRQAQPFTLEKLLS